MGKIFNNPFTDGVTLNPNAWYMKLLHWSYGTKPNDYKNLCPLFWSVVGTICILPLILIFKAFDAMSQNKVMCKIGEVVSIIGKWYLFLFMYFGCTLIFIAALTLLFTHSFHLNWRTIAIVGGSILGFIIFIVMTVYFMEMGSRDEYNTLDETKLIVKLPYLGVKCICKPFTLFGYFIAAVYHKCCPFIHWKSN